MTTPARRPVTDALAAFLAAETGRPIGKGTAPLTAAGQPAEPPYAIVYPLGGGATWGPTYAGPDEGADLPYQVTSVGLRTDQAEWMADRVRQAMLTRLDGTLAAQLAVPGVNVLDRSMTGYGGLDREGDVVSIPDSYVVRVTV